MTIFHTVQIAESDQIETGRPFLQELGIPVQQRFFHRTAGQGM
jgi:hypothetical protein